jgi:hypothetical protein
MIHLSIRPAIMARCRLRPGWAATAAPVVAMLATWFG